MAVLLFLTSTRRFQLCKIPHHAPPPSKNSFLRAIMQLWGFLGATKIKQNKNFKNQPVSCFFPATVETDPRPSSSKVSGNLTRIWGAQKSPRPCVFPSLRLE